MSVPDLVSRGRDEGSGTVRDGNVDRDSSPVGLPSDEEGPEEDPTVPYSTV